ncbi:MAG: YciI family protein [Propionibacteriaceae bacterium]|nr:YciI family protein [Propionibacteriaceae bacterium]
MFILEVAISPTPERLAARPAHRELLAEQHRQGKVLMAGPLADDTAAVVIWDVDTREEVEALMASDPYYSANGVETTSIREWAPFIV